MLKKYLLIIIGIGMLSLVGSYTAPTYNDVNFTLCSGYTAPTYNDVNFTLGLSDACVTDSCTYSSGDWNVDCNDNCTITSNVDLGGNNLSLGGVGSFTIEANITSFGYVFKPNGCQINIKLGDGSLIK